MQSNILQPLKLDGRKRIPEDLHSIFLVNFELDAISGDAML